MRKQSRTWLAVFLIVLGAVMLIALLAGKDAGSLFWPLVFIFVGAWFIFRPSLDMGSMKLRFATEIDQFGEWEVESQEILAFAHEIDYDLTDATIPEGETKIQLTGFATELTLRVPEEVGLVINTSAFNTETKIYGDKQDYVMTGLNYRSPNYAQAERKISFDIYSFAVEVKVR